MPNINVIDDHFKINDVQPELVLLTKKFICVGDEKLIHASKPCKVYKWLNLGATVYSNGSIVFTIFFRGVSESDRVTWIDHLTPIIREIYGQETADWYRKHIEDMLINRGVGLSATIELKCNITHPTISILINIVPEKK